MNSPSLDPFLLFALFAVAIVVPPAIYYFYRVLKYRGLAPAVFGACIEHTVGEFDLGGGMRVKVHMLDGNTPDKAIGVEFVQYAFPVAFALSVSEAQELATMIHSVVGGREAPLG